MRLNVQEKVFGFCNFGELTLRNLEYRLMEKDLVQVELNKINQ